MNVIITHDFMETYGGAERVTQELALAFPDAEVVCVIGRPSVADRMGVGDRWRTLLPSRKRLLAGYRALTPVLPALLSTVQLESCDLVLSSSYAFAHHLKSVNSAPRLCYSHSPLRFAWSMTDEYAAHWAKSTFSQYAFRVMTARMRVVDRRQAQGVARFLTQSPYTADLIRRSYGKEAVVVGAPVDCETFVPTTSPSLDYYLMCGRLIEPYKKPGIVIDAFRRLGRRLLVAGDGPALQELRRSAPPNVEFLGALNDPDLVRAMQNSIAGIFPSRDDFGLIPVEFMACGRPVVAYAAGGALHTVAPGKTGEFFTEQSADCVEQAVRKFDPDRYSSAVIRAHALTWDRNRFRQNVVKHAKTIASDGTP